MMARRLLPALVLVLLAGPLFAGESTSDRFWKARRVLLEGDPATAAELFRTLVKEDPKSEVADDCLYWMARAWLRVPDHEPDAVVALLRLIREYPKSPFVDDAARELRRLGDRTVIPELVKRLSQEGEAARLAALALAEFGEAKGIGWLEAHSGKAPTPPAAPGTSARPADGRGAAKKDESRAGDHPTTEANPPTREAAGAGKDAEIARLRREVERLKRELDESIALLKKLLEERKAEAGREGQK